MAKDDEPLLALMRAIADGDGGLVSRLSKAHPGLAKAALRVGTSSASYSDSAPTWARSTGVRPCRCTTRSTGSRRAPSWRPQAQADTVTILLKAGADPNAADSGGTTPLLRAVRNRCGAAVRALLDGGADAGQANKRGSKPRDLALVASGRGGSGSAEARAEQQEILRLLGGRSAGTVTGE